MKVVTSCQKVVAIHQPNYVPWLGYFYKVEKADLFIFLNDVEFSKNSFINRNRIRTAQGALWLTIPVSAKSNDTIARVRFANKKWREKHLKTLRSAYGKAPFFRGIFPWFEELLMNYHFDNLSDLNIHLIKGFCSKIGIATKFHKCSDYGMNLRGDDRLIALVKTVGGSCYLSGKGGAKYQDPEKFKKANLGFEYYSFQPPVYPQLWGEFIPNLSVLDLLFNVGIKETVTFLRS